MTFQTRHLDVQFALAADNPNGATFASGGNLLTLTGLRAAAQLDTRLGDSPNVLTCQIYGMRQEDMNRLDTIGQKIMESKKNIVRLFTRSGNETQALAFEGTIANASVDYARMPEVCIQVDAFAAFTEAGRAIAVNSYKGSTDVASVVEALAKSIGFAFTNNGVTAKLASPYLSGSAIKQIRDVCKAAGVFYDIHNGSVDIWAAGVNRDNLTFLLSPETGLIGYPEFDAVGLKIKCEYNPDIILGRRIQVKSSIPQGNGIFTARIVRHELAAETPEGPWFTYALLAQESMNVLPR
ncbi:hypothetical protein QE440_001768 [Pseudomonas psychrotolerans]|uniref:Uncharacterized protein n=1 Tax=Pseudomonas oryzihabitans TaxID=47885 RepID=A0AAJ2EVS9_9PSED|nr:hypothetical protein [Pseudomonas psychrotolerans]